jgi:hypothetical protein
MAKVHRLRPRLSVVFARSRLGRIHRAGAKLRVSPLYVLENAMRTVLSIPDLALIGMTRGLLGAGIGLLLADRFEETQRRPLGWGLVAVGLLSTVPLALQVINGLERPAAKPVRPRASTKAAATAK